MLRIERLSKHFVRTKVLSDVSLDVRVGEVHALVGHNGSGKSTLIKILSGFHHPDTGARFSLNGESIVPHQMNHGIRNKHARLSFVHQDLGVVLELNATDNFALHGGFVTSRTGRIRWRKQAEAARRLLRPLAPSFDVTKPMSSATPVERTVVAIAAALQSWQGEGGILVLDEPTAVLPHNEVARLFKIIRNLRESGAGILYVSHRLDEVFEIADRVTILRNGINVATRDVKELTKTELVELMLGKAVATASPVHLHRVPTAKKALEVRGLSGKHLRAVQFTLRAGEILGIAGFPDSGRDELPRLITDQARSAVAGKVRFGDNGGDWINMRRLKNSPIALVPPDRSANGVIAVMTIRENLSLSVLDELGSSIWLSPSREKRLGSEWADRLRILGGNQNSPVRTLSGGNQQKVLIGRTLARKPKVLVLCEPTAGVDIGARQLIYDFINEQAGLGLSVIVASSDAGDLTALCGRVLVLDRGSITHELVGNEINERSLVEAMERSGNGIR